MCFLTSRGSSSRSRSKRLLGETFNPLAIATIVSRLGTFFDRSTSPQKFPVMFPRSAAISRLIFAALRSLLTRCANCSRCFTLQNPSKWLPRLRTDDGRLRSAWPIRPVKQNCNLMHQLHFVGIAKIQKVTEILPQITFVSPVVQVEQSDWSCP
jgi:hypothetical protein